MKNGWHTKTLGDLCSFENGDRGENYPSKSVQTTSGVPFINAGHLAETGIDFSDMNYIPRERFELLGNGKIQKDDILFCLRGSLGKFASVGDLSEGAIASSLVIIRPSAVILNKFVLAYLQSDLCAEMIGKFRNGAAQPNLAAASLKKFEIPVPPSPEQRRIVGILDDAFARIGTAKANSEKNLQNARALFESHLHFVFTHRDNGWVEKSVGQLVAEGALVKPFDGNHGEIHPRKADYTQSGVPFVMASDLLDGSVDTEHCTFISRKLADSLRVGFAKSGDVLISHKGTIGRSAILNTEDDYIMLTPQVTSYRVKDTRKLFNRFIRYYFMSPVFQRQMIAGAADGSTRAYIGITKQLSLHFRFPSLAEQKRIAAELDVLDPETQRLESLYQCKLVALEALKKSLLHQAFSGEL